MFAAVKWSQIHKSDLSVKTSAEKGVIFNLYLHYFYKNCFILM